MRNNIVTHYNIHAVVVYTACTTIRDLHTRIRTTLANVRVYVLRFSRNRVLRDADMVVGQKSYLAYRSSRTREGNNKIGDIICYQLAECKRVFY